MSTADQFVSTELIQDSSSLSQEKSELSLNKEKISSTTVLSQVDIH